MKKNILELLKERVVLFDGATGTQLIERGLKKGECPETWNLDRSLQVKEVHQLYFDAGADVVITNTFGATPAKLNKFNLRDRMEQINRAAVALAKEVCPEDKYVAGSMGPTGLFLPPVGKATPQEIAESYKAQAEILAESGVDLIIIETQYDLKEAVEAVIAAKSTGLPVFVTMTFDKKKRGYFTMMGNSVEDSVKELGINGADVVGANCTLDSKNYVELTRVLKKSTDLPILVQPNAGQPETRGEKVYYQETPEQFTKNAALMLEAGADAIGSCCGSTPEFTRQLANLIRSKV